LTTVLTELVAVVKNIKDIKRHMTEWYKEDLAYIHDVGFSDYALKSAAGILEILAGNQIWEGLIVDSIRFGLALSYLG
jgi:hypothetical protein